MREDPSFAYSLCQSEDGWRWRVFDEDGAQLIARIVGGAEQDPPRSEVERLLICRAFDLERAGGAVTMEIG